MNKEPIDKKDDLDITKALGGWSTFLYD